MLPFRFIIHFLISLKEPSLTDWINAFGSIATVGTLIYVLIKDYKNRKKIDDLAGVILKLGDFVTELKSQNEILEFFQKYFKVGAQY